MSRNIAPWIVPTTASCGVRRNLRIVRRAIESVLVTSPAVGAVRASGTSGAVRGSMVVVVTGCLAFCSDGFGDVGRVLGRLPGEGQEHLVETGVPEGDLVHRDPRGLERQEPRHQV